MKRPWEALEFDVGALRTYDADPERVEMIRARCVAALRARRQRERVRRLRSAIWMAWLEPAIAFGLCALYLATAFTSSLALYR